MHKNALLLVLLKIRKNRRVLGVLSPVPKSARGLVVRAFAS